MQGQNFQTYMINPLDLNNVQLRSGRVLEKKSPSFVIQESEKDGLSKKEPSSHQKENSQKQTTPLHSDDIPIKSTPNLEQPSVSIQTPPFPQRLKIDEGVEKQILFPDYDMIDELKNVCMNIPLLQAINEIPIFVNTIRELSIKRPGRKRK